MYRFSAIIGISIGVIILLSNVTLSESLLWDLLIDAKINSPMLLDEKPIVFGTIVDHAGKPVPQAEVKIRLSTQSANTTTNENGGFLIDFEKISEPGYYVANVIATSSENKMGISRIDFQVKGEVSATIQSENELESFISKYYENFNPQENNTDPIKQKIYQRYQELEEKLSEQQKKETELIEYQEFLAKQREAALEIEHAQIEELNPGAGTFSGFKYEQFVDNLDDSVRDIIVNQMNFTINAFSEAQAAMELSLTNGGTIEEARMAYFEKAAISRDLMESFASLEDSDESESLENHTNSQINNIEENYTVETSVENVQELKSEKTTLIELGEDVTSIILIVNGVEIELIVNGTEISQVPKSDQE